MIRVGITGRRGFVGSYLYNRLLLDPSKFTVVDFERSFFDEPARMDDFVMGCDVIVHLAGLNRHGNDNTIYETNLRLAVQLSDALSRTGSSPRLLFASSTQEERNNAYGRSKKEARLILEDWSRSSGTELASLIIPNVFGPFGRPFYNSFVATFCHQLTNGEVPEVIQDSNVDLMYVGEVVEHFLHCFTDELPADRVILHPTHRASVSQVLRLLQRFHSLYFESGIIPSMDNPFEVNLFNTFRSYIQHSDYFPFKLNQHADSRGVFVELLRSNVGGQISFSTTEPGVTRGNHFHTRKIERFAVVKGRALIQMRRVGSDEVLSFELDGDTPGYVDMPIWYTHNIRNIGSDDLYTVFWINEFFNPDDADTFFETV